MTDQLASSLLHLNRYTGKVINIHNASLYASSVTAPLDADDDNLVKTFALIIHPDHLEPNATIALSLAAALAHPLIAAHCPDLVSHPLLSMAPLAFLIVMMGLFSLAALVLWATNRIQAFQVQIAMDRFQMKYLFSRLVDHYQTIVLSLPAIDFAAAS